YINNKNIPEIEQIYPLTDKITNKMIRNTIYKILNDMKEVKLCDIVGELEQSNIINKIKLSFKQCLYEIHNAKNEHILSPNSQFIEQLALYEILSEQIVLKEISKNNDNIRTPIQKNFNLKEYYLKRLPFNLTKAQEKVIFEIENDIFSNKSMLRLLQGDVGSGKTIVAFLTMLPFLENKKQVAIMCPTSILAEQHYSFFKKNNINVGLLVGGIKQKKQLLQKIENGDIDVIIGTHAIFQDKVKFKELGYVIVDEQHRFGVSQRLELINKGYKTDTLIMSATPIPRTLSLSIYNGISLSIIDEKPKNRKDIITVLIQKNKILELIQKIKNKIEQSEKVYWICPLIDENEGNNVISVNERYNILKTYFEDGLEILHGDMDENKKNKILENFAIGNTKILVSTTVVEVGIDVADATIIVIENPERFGLSQIHQLRGRVGRGEKQSYCVLFYENCGENFKKRMEVLRNTNDGFKIAEEDLKLRGKGEIIGNKQSGMQMRIANLQFHYDLFLSVNKIIDNIANYDNLLKIFYNDKMTRDNLG
ncbi:MAG: ATP-dependent DNA helicase RecG, partial [Rickettsiales bacterium]|nr:ATP-dependent DNA helicase RecG [Rickettsiales bacterium]